MTTLLGLLCCAVLAGVAAQQAQYSTDLLRFEVVRTTEQGTNVSSMFRIPYSARYHIQDYVTQYCTEHDLDLFTMANKVNGLLVQLGILNLPREGVTSSEAVFSVLNSYPFTEKQLLEYETCPEGILDDSRDKAIYFLGYNDELVRQYSNPHVDRLMRGEPFHSGAAGRPPSKIPSHIRGRHRMIVYQTRGVRTGGTVALNSLYETLRDLGYNVTVCGERNHRAADCVELTGDEVVFTGEWCAGVMQDHGIDRIFKGRGVQYHLGFHQASGHCAGHVAVTDSQFLQSSLGQRILGAYFLGCPMRASMQAAWVALLNAEDRSHGRSDVGAEGHHRLDDKQNKPGSVDTDRNSAKGDNASIELPVVIKENLVLLDPDLLADYTPASSISVYLPDWIKIVQVRDVAPDMMPLLLMRAKVVVDLAMPGPERLAGEGAMMGAVPIVSNRWNGASDIDFPRLRKVDHQNASEIAETILDVITNYEFIIQSQYNSAHSPSVFLSYITSMWRRSHFTLDVFAGSSLLHFILAPSTLEQEMIVNFQVLAILYLFPLASIDIYVVDTLWYIRHHYKFYSMLKTAGHIRHDPLDSFDIPDGEVRSRSYVRIRSIDYLASVTNNNLTNVNRLLAYNKGNFGVTVADIDNFLPSWKPVSVYLQPGVIFSSPDILFTLVSKLTVDVTIRDVEAGHGVRGVLFDSSAPVADVVSAINSALALNVGPNRNLIPNSDVRALVGYYDCQYKSMSRPYKWSQTQLSWMNRCGISVPQDGEDGTHGAARCDSSQQCRNNGRRLLSRFLEALVQSDQWKIELNTVWQTMNCKFLREIML